AAPGAAAVRVLGFDHWRLDLEARLLLDAAGRAQALTTQEFNLLSALAQRPGRVLSRDQLLDLTVGRHWSPYDRSIDVMIGKIRRKIGDTGPEHRRIRTIRGAGYMFSPDP
ncbi:winged helix-turn-helix domain-containing protein, partial [Paracoccus sp. PXZ]